MNRRSLRFPILIALFALTVPAAWGGDKVQVCHIPPGNPGNFRTLTVSQNAEHAHLGHGDLAGACSLSCALLCSDENPCTTGECAGDVPLQMSSRSLADLRRELAGFECVPSRGGQPVEFLLR